MVERFALGCAPHFSAAHPLRHGARAWPCRACRPAASREERPLGAVSTSLSLSIFVEKSQGGAISHQSKISAMVRTAHRSALMPMMRGFVVLALASVAHLASVAMAGHDLSVFEQLFPAANDKFPPKGVHIGYIDSTPRYSPRATSCLLLLDDRQLFSGCSRPLTPCLFVAWSRVALAGGSMPYQLRA